MPKRTKTEPPLPSHLSFEEVLVLHMPPHYGISAVKIGFARHSLIRDYLAWVFAERDVHWEEDGSLLIYMSENVQEPVKRIQEYLLVAKERYEREEGE